MSCFIALQKCWNPTMWSLSMAWPTAPVTIPSFWMRNEAGCMLEQRITYFHSTWLISRIFKRYLYSNICTVVLSKYLNNSLAIYQCDNWKFVWYTTLSFQMQTKIIHWFNHHKSMAAVNHKKIFKKETIIVVF